MFNTRRIIDFDGSSKNSPFQWQQLKDLKSLDIQKAVSLMKDQHVQEAVKCFILILFDYYLLANLQNLRNAKSYELLTDITDKTVQLCDLLAISMAQSQVKCYFCPVFNKMSEFVIECIRACIDDKESRSQFFQKLLNGLRRHVGRFRNPELDNSYFNVYITLLSISIRLALYSESTNMANSLLSQISSVEIYSSVLYRNVAATFVYLTGCKLMNDDQYDAALVEYYKALTLCTPRNGSLLRDILIKLFVIKLYKGYYLKRQYLENHNLLHYKDVVDAVLNGKLALFEATLKKNANLYFLDGTIECILKLRTVVIQKVCKATISIFSAKSPNQVFWDLSIIRKALNFSNENKLDEFETIEYLIYLISTGHIRGYISLEQNKLILSRNNPFPLML